MTPILGQFEVPFLDRWAQSWFGWYGYELAALLSVVLICALCGMVGALVVGNRMAFFSDAMAHCAFAGVALGVLSVLFGGPNNPRGQAEMMAWAVPLVMVTFGVLVGAGMVFVRDRTGLADDTVIGVFFALALGMGAMLITIVKRFSNISVETFLFGNLFFITEADLVFLCGAAVLVAGVFLWRYNQFMFASFNPSLGRTRRMTV